jgi:hypothetical protein
VSSPAGRHRAGRPSTLHLLRSFGSGVGGIPNFTTQCTCGEQVRNPDVTVHNAFRDRHAVFYPSSAYVWPEDWATWFTVAERQGHDPRAED